MHCIFNFGLGLLALSAAGATTAMTPEPLRIHLDVPHVIHAGGLVPIVIRLENAGAHPLDLYLRGRTIAFDIFITRADGEPVWQRLKDEIIPAIVQVKTLRPGEVLELRHEWNQRDNGGKSVRPGSYIVRGVVLTDGPTPLRTPSASLQIQAR